MAKKMRSLNKNMRDMQGLVAQECFYKDLCMFPNVHLPLGFKTLKFDKYEGHNDSLTYLKKVL